MPDEGNELEAGAEAVFGILSSLWRRTFSSLGVRKNLTAGDEKGKGRPGGVRHDCELDFFPWTIILTDSEPKEETLDR